MQKVRLMSFPLMPLLEGCQSGSTAVGVPSQSADGQKIPASAFLRPSTGPSLEDSGTSAGMYRRALFLQQKGVRLSGLRANRLPVTAERKN